MSIYLLQQLRELADELVELGLVVLQVVHRLVSAHAEVAADVRDEFLENEELFREGHLRVDRELRQLQRGLELRLRRGEENEHDAEEAAREHRHAEEERAALEQELAHLVVLDLVDEHRLAPLLQLGVLRAVLRLQELHETRREPGLVRRKRVLGFGCYFLRNFGIYLCARK